MDKLDSMLGLDMAYFDQQVNVLIEYYKKRKDYRKWGEGSCFTNCEKAIY